ncbi:MAG: hypothetical protein WCJ64_05780 [Rhodospirillaceae bacterium]
MQHRRPVERQVDHAVEDDDVDAGIGDRQMFDLAETELDVGEPSLAAFSRAVFSISWGMSTPITRPASPTCRAARKAPKPAPLPRSTTTSSGLRQRPEIGESPKAF